MATGKMNRPRPHLKPTSFDLLLEGLSLLGLLALVALPLLYWGQLPDAIPTHFDASGRPDSYGRKGSLLALPAIAIALYVVLTAMQRVPHTFNYPIEVNADNAKRLYRHSVRMLRLLKMTILLGFTFILHRVILVVLGQAQGLGAWFVPAFLLTIALATGYGLWPAFRR